MSRTVTLDGRDLPIVFAAGEGSLFSISIVGASLDIAGVLTVEGNLTFSTGVTLSAGSGGGTGDVFGGTGLKVFMGDGPATLASGDVNPLARGLLISNATIGLVRVGLGAGALYALDAQGDLELVGFRDVTFTGRVHFRVNTFTHPIDETIAVAGTDTSVAVTFGPGEVAATAAFTSAGGSGLQLNVLGQALSGDFTFARSAGELRITAAHAGFALRDASGAADARGPPIAQLTDGTGDLRFSSAGVAGALGGTITLGVNGVSLSTGRFLVALNTTTAAAAVTDPADATKTVALPAGPYVRVAATGATLTVAGQSLSGDFDFERGPSATRVTLANVTVDLGSFITPPQRAGRAHGQPGRRRGTLRDRRRHEHDHRLLALGRPERRGQHDAVARRGSRRRAVRARRGEPPRRHRRRPDAHRRPRVRERRRRRPRRRRERLVRLRAGARR